MPVGWLQNLPDNWMMLTLTRIVLNNFIRRWGLLAVLALAGCSSTPKAPAVHPGLSVFDKAIGLPANPHSIVREGDQVTYVVTSPDEQFIYARFDASCSQGLASMRFPTTMGMVPFSGGAAPSDSLPAPQLQQFLSSAQLRDVCAQRPSPDWRALEQAKEGDWLSLDRSSLQRENGLLYVWVEQSPLHYTVSSKGMGLTGRSQERLVLDCQQNTLMQVSQSRRPVRTAEPVSIAT